MTNRKIWLSSPHMGGEEKKFVNEAFETNWVAPLGPNVNGFESDLQSYLNEDIHVAALSSGTAAIHLALIMLGVGAGDEVICQSMTFSASANPILYVGATPIFIDSERATWNMCPVQLELAIKDRLTQGKKPKTIIPVHLYGMPANMREIVRVANLYEIPVLEDAAEALGSTLDGQKCGTFGALACLSFNGNKIITTSGGGALVSKERLHKDKAVFLSTQARDNAPHYQHSEIGYNYRMSNISAGIGRGQMLVLEEHIALRRRNFEYYLEAFKEHPYISLLQEPEGYHSNRWLSCITISSESNVNREQIRLALEKENIEARPLWKPMHMQPIFRKHPFYGSDVSENLFDTGLCLPSGSNLNAEELGKVVKIVNSCFNF